jgi:two-component system, cell cycle response regulator
MVASDSPHSHNPTRAPRATRDCLSAAELTRRLEEEVSRAERHHTALSCLLVSLDDMDRLAHLHGEDLPAKALAYFGAALGLELRRFDRVGHAAEGELLVLLPGADERRGEIVARRALGRLHAIKIDVDGQRHPLRISVGLAAWREGLTGEQLLSLTRLAAQRHDAPRERRSDPSPAPNLGADGMPGLRQS